LTFFKLNPEDRKQQYHKLTFSMMYYYDENFLLPFSHDEVVHGKATILQKMNGQYEEKFPQGRALYMYMYAHPGKKLNFMGNEIGQLREWDEAREQDWDILQYPKHEAFALFMKDLSTVYLKNLALSEYDYSQDGFKWIDCHQEEACIYVFERKSNSQKMVVLLNLSSENQLYHLNTDAKYNELSLMLSSDEKIYGGNGNYAKGTILKAENNIISIEAPAFSAMYFEVMN